MADPLPPIRWVCEPLGITPGPPIIVAGYGYSRKTLALQDLALSVASGRDAWTTYPTTRGAVLHIDYEQGRRVTDDRYQRLALGRGIDLASLGALLRVSSMPSMYLDDPTVEGALELLVTGASLCIVDSLRAAMPDMEENDSSSRKPLDRITRISERSGCAFVFIHHAKKPSKDSQGAQYAMRGSGSLFDACAGQFIFAGERGQPTRVSHTKNRTNGRTLGDFALTSVDVDVGGRPGGGLRVVQMGLESLDAPSDDGEAFAAMKRSVMLLLGKGGLDAAGVKARIRARGTVVQQALQELAREGAIRRGPMGFELVPQGESKK